MTAQVDALVIGAGWSGLVCALRLSKAGKKVICLEARSRLGGRAFTHSWNDETPMSNNERIVKEDEVGSKTHHVDFGCSYIHGYNEGNPVKEIAKKYNVQTYIAKPTSTHIIGPNGVLNSQLSEKLQTNLQSAQSFAKEKANQIRKSSSTLGKISLSSILLEDPSSPLFNNLQDENERQLAISLSRSMHIPLGTEIENVALEYFGHEKAFGGTDAMPEGGFSTLIAKLAEEFKQSGGQIHKGEEVKKILHLNDSKSNSIQVITSKQIDGNSASTKEEKYSARTAIVTIPLAVLKNQHQTLFEPSLENERKEAIERINVGNLNKVLLTYEKPWWNSDVGTFFVLSSKSQSSSNAIPTNTLKDLFESTTMIVSSLCAPTGYSDQMKSYSLLVMIGGEHAKVLEKHDRITVAEALNEYLFSRLTKDSQTPKLSHTFYSRWAKQPFTQGATTTPIVLGSSPNDLLTISKPTWNNSLHFAGEHCEINHRGSIVGAVLSGQNASESVLQYLKENGMASL